MMEGMRGTPDELNKGTHPWYEKGYSAWVQADKTQTIFKGALEVLSLFVTCNSNACTVTAYDGDNTVSRNFGCFDAQAARTMPFVPPEPFKLNNGLHLVLSGDVKCVLVQYRPIPAGWRP